MTNYRFISWLLNQELLHHDASFCLFYTCSCSARITADPNKDRISQDVAILKISCS